MNTILIYIVVAVLSAIGALSAYIVIRKVLLKGQKEEIIRKAEIEAESIKKEKISRQRRSSSSSRASTSSISMRRTNTSMILRIV